MQSFPAARQPAVLTADAILALLRRHKAPTFLCFRQVVLMDRMAFNKDGGIFAGFFSADWMRALSYKHAGLFGRAPLTPLRMGVLERSTDRKWIDLQSYLRAIQAAFGEVAPAGMTHL